MYTVKIETQNKNQVSITQVLLTEDKEDNMEFICKIIGDGPLMNKLVDKTNELKLDQNILFVGSMKAEEIPSILEETDVFILACATDEIEGHDGIPLVFIEAMAYGVPVIGTKISGIPELIIDRNTGLCARSEDPVSIRECLHFLINHPKKTEEMRLNARKKIEKEFDIEIVCQQLRQHFKTSVVQ